MRISQPKEAQRDNMGNKNHKKLEKMSSSHASFWLRIWTN